MSMFHISAVNNLISVMYKYMHAQSHTMAGVTIKFTVVYEHVS